jgi:DNA-binding PadR family transcriptional regulator
VVEICPGQADGGIERGGQKFLEPGVGLRPTRFIDVLVADGLVRRSAVSTNHRQVALTLTAQGRATLEKIRGEIRSHLM